MSVGNNFFGQTVSFKICLGLFFSQDKIYCLDPSKQPWALPNLWTLTLLASQIPNAKLQFRLCSALTFSTSLHMVKNMAKWHRSRSWQYYIMKNCLTQCWYQNIWSQKILIKWYLLHFSKSQKMTEVANCYKHHL